MKYFSSYRSRERDKALLEQAIRELCHESKEKNKIFGGITPFVPKDKVFERALDQGLTETRTIRLLKEAVEEGSIHRTRFGRQYAYKVDL